MSKTYAFGVDIGGTTIKMGLFETNGKLLEMWEIPTRTEADGKFMKRHHKGGDENEEKEYFHLLDVEGIGLGVPGPVGPDGTVFKCVNLGWTRSMSSTACSRVHWTARQSWKRCQRRRAGRDVAGRWCWLPEHRYGHAGYRCRRWHHH